ncbi:MAG: patatin-like phospholipase family protein [Hyphomicrobiaceae bacterium]|nr:patatin-like phospholipase family protein [Hyphomicrobiaceae bacterium]
MERGKIGLALGGGAARGWAHIGVLRALAAKGIHPDIVVGTSIGAVVGGCYSAGRLDDLEDFARSLTRRKVFGFLDFNFAGSGLISGQRLCNTLESHLESVNIEGLATRFAAVATEIGTGHEIWVTQGRLVDAMRASYALPGIFKPVAIKGRWLFDGALVNPIPVSVCRALGASMVIAVNLNSDMCGRGTVVPLHDSPDLPLPPAAEEAPAGKLRNGRAALKLLHRQFFGRNDAAPGISRVMVEAFNIVQDRIARSRLAGDPPDIVITPRLQGTGLFDFHRAEDLIDLGRRATERELDEIDRLAEAARRPRASLHAAGPI